MTFTVIHTDDPTLYRVLDINKPRTNGEMLHAEGIKSWNGVAAAARLVLIFEDYHAITSSSRTRMVTTRLLILDEVASNTAIYEAAVNLAGRNKAFNPSAFSAFCVLLSRRADDWREWIESAITGANLEMGDPRLAALQWSLNVRKDRKQAPSLTHLSVLIRARNAHVTGRKLASSQSWQPGNAFPTFIETKKEN